MNEELENLSAAQLTDWWYKNKYQFAYKGLAGMGHRLFHNQLERGHSAKHFEKVLEVGANLGQHLDFVKHSFGEYILSDVRAYDENIKADITGKFGANKLTFSQEDVSNLSFADNYFDRVVVTCVLPHLSDPETALLEIRRIIKNNGVADIYLGHDPGLIFDFVKQLGPIRVQKKDGFGDLKTLVDAREHTASGRSIMRLLRHVFRYDFLSQTWFPFPKNYHLSLWSTFRVRINK
jgi:ubiquinone/menaquinone biosynthesis C-methylase UbiE